ncbi:MAG: ATP-dependent DNA ligase [bacterium]
MKFFEVAEVFEQLEKESKRLKITELLADLLRKATPDEAAIIAYLSLGSLRPTYLTTQFNFAQKSMVKVIATLLDKSDVTVVKYGHKSGDLGSIISEQFQNRVHKHLSLKDVNNKLLEFLEISGIGSQEKKDKELLALLKDLDPLSGKYVVRIILGHLRLGFSDMTLLDAFSWMEHKDKSIRKKLEDAYNICVDIGEIVKILKENELKGIEKISITPGIPIRPAAAERAPDAKAILKKIGPCVAQPKLDGFRLQVHIDKTKRKHIIRFFSRNLQDMSAMFPELYEAIQECKVETFVGEGEAIAYDTSTKSFLPFQETVKRKRKYDIEKVAQDFPLKLYFFDLLYLNGESYLDKSHEDRRQALANIIQTKKVEKEEVLFLVEEKKIKDTDALEKYFMENISSGLEGLVVKRPDAVYQPGKRNFNWIKLKRQESGSLEDTIDCVILGYYFGRGKRASFGIGALLVGIYDKKHDVFVTVAKVGTGLTDKQWKEQKKMCDDIKVQNKPHDVECAKELYPDIWVSPKIVCVIRADEITRSPLHTAGATKDEAGFALRFPRLMDYRSDKAATDATTVKELKELFDIQFEKSQKKRPKKTSKKPGQKSIFE